MRKKILGLFFLFLLVLLFTGCEQAINIPDELSAIQAYDKEVIVTIMDALEIEKSSDFPEYSHGSINGQVSYYVEASWEHKIDLDISLRKWVASDGTEVSGTLRLSIHFDSSDTPVIDYLNIDGYLTYEGTIAIFEEGFANDSSESGEFIIRNNNFICYLLSKDGESILNTLDIYINNKK